MLGGYPTEVRELPHVCPSPLDLPSLNVSWSPAKHRPESITYRLEGENGAFVCTGDTGYSESVVDLAQGAHSLLIECAFPDGGAVPGHLTPSGVARIAREAGVDRVALTHIYPPADELDLQQEVGHGFHDKVLVAEDGMQFSI
jgi:ribonuclease BN (tRNA processing enzyme)